MPNLLVSAGPGCGKTTSLVDAYIYKQSQNTAMFQQRFNSTDEQVAMYDWIRKYWPSGCKVPCYMAYSKEIVEHLSKTVHPDCKDHVKTHHGWGYTEIKKKYGYIPINADRSRILVEKITNTNFQDLKNKFDWLSTIRFVEKLKEECLPISDENFHLLQQKYSSLAAFKVHDDICAQAGKLVSAMKIVEYKIGLEFVDQIWLALFLIKSPVYPLGFVDECQDLSPLRLRFSQLFCENLVYCGDENQGINAWNGADPLAMETIRADCMTELPLKLSFRLPPNHAMNANRIRPTANIRSLPGRSDGGQVTIDTENLMEWCKESINKDKNPMILCRYNAPLVHLSLSLLKQGIPSKLLGKSETKNLISTVENRNARDISDLIHKLSVYEDMILKNGDEMAKETNRKRFEAIRHVLAGCSTVSEFKPLITALGNPPKSERFITLTTVHSAKGRESKVIGILNPPIPSTKAKTSIQVSQEECVDFVGHTRTSQDQAYLYLR